MTRTMLLTLAASALLPAAAFAQSGDVAVRFDDLNLSSRAGLETLDKRIELASRQICRNEDISGSRIKTARQEKACKADVRRQIEEQLPKQASALARN